jgi:predicted amidophosphoribosyltransferase
LSFAAFLERTNNSRQVGSTKKQRLAQARGTYRAKNDSDIKHKTILLIDDVATTGATLEAATKVLKQAGAKKVYSAVFACSN